MQRSAEVTIVTTQINFEKASHQLQSSSHKHRDLEPVAFFRQIALHRSHRWVKPLMQKSYVIRNHLMHQKSLIRAFYGCLIAMPNHQFPVPVTRSSYPIKITESRR